MSKKDIAARLRNARLAARKTQKEAADAVGMTYQAISNYERGKTNVESGVLIRLCQFYGVSVPDILGDSTPSSELDYSDEEKQLIVNYRKLSPDGVSYIQQQMTIALTLYAGKNIAVSDLEAAE